MPSSIGVDGDFRRRKAIRFKNTLIPEEGNPLKIFLKIRFRKELPTWCRWVFTWKKKIISNRIFAWHLTRIFDASDENFYRTKIENNSFRHQGIVFLLKQRRNVFIASSSEFFPRGIDFKMSCFFFMVIFNN